MTLIFEFLDQLRLQDQAALALSGSGKVWSLIVKTGDTEKSLTLSMNESGAFDIDFEDGTNIKLDKGFSLWDKISSIKADETEHSFQLIKKDFNDVFRLRFKGTALDVEVIPEHVAKYRKFMKEKPKLDESKIIIGKPCMPIILIFFYIYPVSLF